MELTPEERQRIYEEEKARIEGLQAQPSVSQPSPDSSEDPLAYKVGILLARLSNNQIIAIGLGGFIVLALVIYAISDSETSNISRTTTSGSISPSVSTPSTEPQKQPTTTEITPASHLSAAKNHLGNKVSEYDLTQAKEHLEQIPNTAPEYTEARRILGEIKSRKIKPISEFEAANAEVIELIKQINPDITYAKLKKNADNYIGQAWGVTGKILEIQESGNYTVARVGIGSWGLDAIFVEGNFTTEFVEKDRVYVAGYINGSKTYESQAGWTITIPWLKASVMLKPTEAARIITAAKR